MIAPYWKSADGRHVIYNADCLQVLPELDAGSVDAVVTDPPYGVGFKYESHDDSRNGYPEWCDQWFAELKKTTAGPVAISCGTVNICNWPQPSWVMCWHKPACMGRCPIGFNNWEPILVYGKTRGTQTNDVVRAPIIPSDDLSGHPCPKPLGWAVGIVKKLTKSEDCILDPFCGSGTTGVACVRTNRRFIGIEIEKRYCDIAVKRIERELSQPMLPFAESEKVEQSLLFDE